MEGIWHSTCPLVDAEQTCLNGNSQELHLRAGMFLPPQHPLSLWTQSHLSPCQAAACGRHLLGKITATQFLTHMKGLEISTDSPSV